MEKRTGGSLKFEVYPGSSLMKTNSQYSAMREGALDMCLLPLAYAGGEMPEMNMTPMLDLVTSYGTGRGVAGGPRGPGVIQAHGGQRGHDRHLDLAGRWGR